MSALTALPTTTRGLGLHRISVGAPMSLQELKDMAKKATAINKIFFIFYSRCHPLVVDNLEKSDIIHPWVCKKQAFNYAKRSFGMTDVQIHLGHGLEHIFHFLKKN